MENNSAVVRILGSRGTTPLHDAAFARYGGATSCVLADIGGELIFLDAGSGFVSGRPFITAETEHFSILLSHPHIDHMIGLTMFAPFYDGKYRVTIYGADRMGLTVKEQIKQLMSLPVWPVSPDSFSHDTKFLPVSERFSIGDVEVCTMEGNHPGGCTVYRLSHGGKSIVYCTDFEHTPELSAKLVVFAEGCNVLIYDAQFSDEEYASRHGSGHSTWNEGIKTAQRCGAAQLVFFHHAPTRSDAELSAIEASLKGKFANLSFGKCGDTLVLTA